MHVEITDIQSSRNFRIEGGDKVLGREGASADIGVPDRAVSGKHARIFNSSGKWYLEDLGSSNGTFVQGSRISAPVELKVGMRFALCRYAYEVAEVVVPGGDATAVFDDPGYSDEVARTQVGAPPRFAKEHESSKTGTPEGAATRPIEEARANALAEQSAVEADPQGASAPSRQAHVSTVPHGGERGHAGSQAGGAPENQAAAPDAVVAPRDVESYEASEVEPYEPVQSQGDASGNEAFGLSEPIVPYLLKNVPLAIAYYMAAVPVLLTNPLGTIRKSIEQPKFGAMGKMELAAYGAAAALASIAFGWIGGILATLVGAITSGTFSFGAIISALLGPLIPGIISLAVSVVVGLFWHQIMDWLIPKLQGKNDHVTNSNYFVGTQTAVLIGALASAVSSIFSAIHIPFLGLPGPVVSLFGALITAFVLYSWLKRFEVHKVLPIVVLVVMAVFPSIGTVKSLIHTVSYDISRLGSGGDGDVEDIEEMAALDPEPDEALEAGEKSAIDPKAAAALAAARKANPAAAAALAQAQGKAVAAKVAKGLTAEQRAQLEAATKAARAIDATEQKPAAGPSPAPQTKPTSAVVSKPTSKIPPNVASPEKSPSVPSTPIRPKLKRGRSGYPTYKLHRDAIENAIERDPTLLSVPGVMGLYRQLYRTTAKVVQKKKIKLGRRPSPDQLADAKVAEMTREADIYKATAQIVEKLYAKLF